MAPVRLSSSVRGLESCFKQLRLQAPQSQSRTLTTATFAYRPPEGRLQIALRRKSPEKGQTPGLRKIRVPEPAIPIKKICAEPLKAFNSRETTLLDPAGTRTRLISRTNPDALHVGDVALVRFKNGDPFAGLVLNIRRRGQDTGILLRSELTRVAVEMWVKLFSPKVAGVEIVQRAQKRVRRARAYYFRKTKHDRGSVAHIVDAYTRDAARLGRKKPSGKEGSGQTSKRS